MSDGACLALVDLGDAPEPAGEVEGTRSVVLRGGSGAILLLSADDPDRLRMAAEGWGETTICGIDPSALAARDDVDAPACFIDLVLDPARPPIPFDDEAAMAVSRDYQRWYLPMLGKRVVRCETLWHDGVRAAGSVLAFTAASEDEASYFADANPWRRIAPGKLLRCPPGVFARGAPSLGPGTQRSDVFVCGEPDSVPEPGTGA